MFGGHQFMYGILSIESHEALQHVHQAFQDPGSHFRAFQHVVAFGPVQGLLGRVFGSAKQCGFIITLQNGRGFFSKQFFGGLVQGAAEGRRIQFPGRGEFTGRLQSRQGFQGETHGAGQERRQAGDGQAGFWLQARHLQFLRAGLWMQTWHLQFLWREISIGPVSLTASLGEEFNQGLQADLGLAPPGLRQANGARLGAACFRQLFFGFGSSFHPRVIFGPGCCYGQGQIFGADHGLRRCLGATGQLQKKGAGF